MRKSMLSPGKQHNFRVSADASWTDAFNRMANKNKWSSNKTMNVLIHSALNMSELTDESITVEISPKELEILLRLRQTPNPSIIVPEDTPTPAKVSQPVVESPVVEESVPEEPKVVAQKETTTSDTSKKKDPFKRNPVLEKALRHMESTKI